MDGPVPPGPRVELSLVCDEPFPDRSIRYDTIRYDTRCYINVRSKANRQLKSVKTEKLKVENRYAQKYQ